MNNIPLITNANNRYYAGMTLKEAKAKDLEKSFWHRDFHNIDKNKDGVLSVDEIMNERKRSSTINKIIAVTFAGLGTIDLISNIKDGSKIGLLIDLALDTYIGYSAFNRAMKTDQKTKEYEQQLQKNFNAIG